MSKEIYISSTPHETRLAIVENDALAEIYYERENEYTLAGSIYNGKVTRVLPGMQSSFVDIGLERDAFLYITDFLEEAPDSADFDTADTRSAGSNNGGGARRERAPREEGGSSEGGRERGRGGRDRNRNRGEGRTVEGRSAETSNQPTTIIASDDFDAPEGNELAAGHEPAAETGDAGAEGGRRWRGRRGRRRGRGADAPGEQTTEAAPQEQAPEQAIEIAAVAAPAEDRPAREERSRDRGGRERGGRERGGRDRGGRERGGNRERDVRDRFAPRGDRSGGSSREEASVEAGPAVEPFILPGESLGKYRKGDDGAPEAKAPAFAAPMANASTEFVLTEAWDGGFVLPGETLSRRGGERNDRSERNDRGSRRGVESNLSAAERSVPAVTSGHEPEAFELPLPAAPVGSESVIDEDPYEFRGPHATEEEHVAAVEEATLEVEEIHAEYEPSEEDAVSYRVDPVAPSEFRQSAPAQTPDEFLALEAEGDKELVEEEQVEDEALTDLPDKTFTADEEDAYVEEALTEEAAAPTHEFTAVQDSGEMLSEAAPATEQETAPIVHETVIQSVTLSEAETRAELAPMASGIYAPGEGQLEEEELDDEDGDFVPSLQASASDDTEEEVLEHAADLGTMIDEMSIDKIVAPDAEEDEDDFDIDEEDLDEDRFVSSGDEGDEFSSAETSEGEEEEFAEGIVIENGDEAPAEEGQKREGGGERRGRRDGRGRRGDRDRGARRDSRGMANSRSSSNGGGGGGGRSRQSAQTTNLPDISELLKPGQEVLVQIAKEPIAKKGARITSHIALPGRFLVFMPTVNHVGVSRKIESDGERRRLKEILLSEKGEASGGFIVRTAAANASEDELRSDLRFLLNLWSDIKQRSESSKSPALIYHDLNLIERILRDQVTDNFSAIWVDSEAEYERVLRFLQRFQPSLMRRVKLYTKDTPLFEQFGITEEINKALRSKVWLKSGGSIVINQTEALVAIDINTGKYVGKTARLEDTIVKTNLDAIPEIVRQIRLRDLGGIIIIDFIDMDERKNRNKVMAALEEELKNDRAPSKVLQFNDFGLVAITRKRVKQSLERTLSATCGVCAGTGMVKSPVTVCNDIYVEMRKMQKHLDRGDVMLRVNPEVVKQLKAPGTKWLQEMEDMVGRTILVKSDPSIHPEQFDIH